MKRIYSNHLLYLVILQGEWTPHYFVLTESKLYYSEEAQVQSNVDDDDTTSQLDVVSINLWCTMPTWLVSHTM